MSSSVIGLVRYVGMAFIYSQRYLPPALMYVALLAILTNADTGPLVGVYTISGGALFGTAAWVTVALANTLSPVTRHLAVTAARRGPRDVLAATVIVAIGADAALIVIGLLFPIISGSHAVTSSALVVGAEVLAACALTGNAIGLLCGRPIITRQGFSLLAALGAVVLLLLLKDVPPVDPSLVLLNSSRAVGSMVGPAAGFAVVGLVLLGVAAGVSHYLAVRRD